MSRFSYYRSLREVISAGITVLLLVSIRVGRAQSPGDLIVFMSDRDGNREIYTMNPDGSDARRLTNNEDQDLQPAWAPDKSRIAFVSNREGSFAIYIMNADGSNQQRISTDEFAYHEYPAWSPDGRYLAYASDKAGSFDVYTVEANGNNPQRLTSGDTYETEPAWSPDGRQIAYLQQVEGVFEVFLVSTNDGTPQSLTQSNGGEYFSPRWSPDGNQLAYALTIFDRAGNSSEIYVRDTASGEESLLISRENSFVQGLSWSEDGNDIAYQVKEEPGNWVIHRVSTSDGTFQVLTDETYNSETPSWFTPLSEIARPESSCPDLPDAIVSNGERAHVTYSPGSSNNVRSQPSTNARRITQIAPGVQFDIIDGPICADDYRWWHIRLDDGTTGWTADGDRNDRWIEPLR